MEENFVARVGERIREERSRLSLQQAGVADACQVSRRALWAWENGAATPNSAALAVMAGLGFDVLYVITGARVRESESTLAPGERNLLHAWRHTDAKGRALLSAAAEVLKAE